MYEKELVELANNHVRLMNDGEVLKRFPNSQLVDIEELRGMLVNHFYSILAEEIYDGLFFRGLIN